MAHGYLLHQFFSPLYNHREDEYGVGSIADRARLAGRVLRAVRERVGADFTVGVRMSLGDFFPGGMELDDVIGIGRELAATARVDFFNLSGPGYHAFSLSVPPVGGPPDGWLAESSGAFRAAVDGTPVFLVGGIRRPEQVDAILAAGQADVVALTREQLAEPAWVEKVRSGRERGDHALHPRQPGLLHEPHARIAHPLHREPRRGPRVGLPPVPQTRTRAPLVAGRRRRPRRHEGRRDARQARPHRDAGGACRSPGRPGQPAPARARPRGHRPARQRSRGRARSPRRRRPPRDRAGRGRRARARRRPGPDARPARGRTAAASRRGTPACTSWTGPASRTSSPAGTSSRARRRHPARSRSSTTTAGATRPR